MDETTIRMRKVLGILGTILAPIVLTCGLVTGDKMMSISATHYNPQYLLFEGLVVAVGIFLIAYRGYDIGDSISCKIAGVGGLVLSYFPTAGGTWNFLRLPSAFTNILHIIGALVFFFALGYLIYFRFSKGESKRKNIMYKVLACLMIGSILLGGTIDMIIKLAAKKYYEGITVGPLFIGEGLGLLFFGVAWLIKGRMFDNLFKLRLKKRT